ncbi:MAG TPA: WD40 repeat domain-containing protein [Gemmataceae bacterium]|nr:WD40 repeat domain-containing protein [Gemmataceae bacterium]
MRFPWWLVLPLLLLLTPLTAAAQSEQKKAAPRLDQFGDPLPEGAFYRLGTERMRHSSAETLIFSADGKQLLSGGGRTTELRVWDIATGDLLKKLPQECPYGHLIASPDDRYLAAECNASVMLIDKANGKILASWAPGHWWHCLAFEKDSKTLVGLGKNDVVYRWDVKTLKEVSQQPLANIPKEFQTGRKAEWIISSDGLVVAGKAGNYDAENRHRNLPWRYWDTAAGKELERTANTGTAGWRTWLSSDGRYLAGNNDGYANEVWDTIAGKRLWLDPMKTAKNEAAPALFSFVVAFDPNNKQIAIGYKGKLALYEMATGKALWMNEPSNGVTTQCIVFTREGKLMATTDGKVITVMDSTNGKPVGFSVKDPGLMTTSYSVFPPANFCPDSQSFVTLHGEYLSLRNTSTGQEMRRLVKGYVKSMSADGRFVLVERVNDGPGINPQLWWQGFSVVDLKTGNESSMQMQSQGNSVVIAADGSRLAWLRHIDGRFTLFETITDRVIKTFNWRPGGPKPFAFGVVLSPSLKMAAKNIGLSRGDWEIWDLEADKSLRFLESSTGANISSFLPDGRRLVGINQEFDGENSVKATTWLWDVASGKKLFGLPGAFKSNSPNGKWLLVKSANGFALSSAETGRLHIELPHEPSFSGTGDGALLTTVEDNRRVVKVRETISGLILHQWRFSSCGATLSPDGRTLIISVPHGTLLAYDATGLASEPGKLLQIKLTKTDADRYWADLASMEGPRVHKALWTMIAAGNQGVQALKERVKALDTKEAETLAADLDSATYAVREKAMSGLPKLAAAEQVLKKTLASKPSLEVKQRIELLLAKLPAIPQDPELLRLLRVIFILEQIDTMEARQYLETLAGGPPDAHVTREAAATLERVRTRQ